MATVLTRTLFKLVCPNMASDRFLSQQMKAHCLSTVSPCSNASVVRRVLAACVSLLWQGLLIADTLTGTVIKITDGDTPTVLDSEF
jgi:hypothetical protein